MFCFALWHLQRQPSGHGCIAGQSGSSVCLKDDQNKSQGSIVILLLIVSSD